MDVREKIRHLFSDQTVQKRLKEVFNVRFVALFGSMASGRSKQESDVDLAILFEQELSKKQEERLMDYLRKLLTVDKLDVVCLNDVACSLRYEVSQDGILLFENREDDYISFCIRTFKEYEEMNFLNRHYHELQIEELTRFTDAQS
jgi:predicted nucleotidyltransferase